MNESRTFKKRINRNMDIKGGIWSGAFILLVGVAALAKSFIIDMNWLFSWQMLLIALGCFIGVRNKFRGGGWLAMILIGSYFLIESYFVFDHSLRRFFWPLALIGLGAYLIFRPYRSKNIFSNANDLASAATEEETSANITSNTSFTNADTTNTTGQQAILEQEILDVVSVFSGIKKNIYSKNFKGGEIVCVFGGAEINLVQANFQQPQIEIESVQIFGGAKLIVPSDWVIHNEAVAIFGGIEDKRPQPVAIPVPAKILVLKGFVMFGGIEIKSY